MNSMRQAADRIRPFLDAMERSITAARQRRLSTHHQPTGPAVTPTGGPVAPPAFDAPPVPEDAPVNPDARARLRARPKRPESPPGFRQQNPAA
jgi:hypothetical protein